MTTLPENWRHTTLGAIGHYWNGRGFKKSEWRESGRPIIRIQNLTGSGDEFNYYDGDAEEHYIARRGDLLISWAATLGAFIWDGPEAVVNQHIFKVESLVNPRFHKYLLDFKLDELMRRAHGSGMVHVTRRTFDSLPVIIPESMDEQRRIVELLDDHLSRLDAADTYMTSASIRTEQMATSVLAHDPDVRSAPIVSLKELLERPLANGRSVPTREGGFPVLRLTALKDGYIDLSQRKDGAWTEAEAKPFLVSKGDFFASRGNGSLRLVARGGLVQDDPGKVAFPDTLIRIRVDETICDPRYFSVVWNSPLVRRQIEAMARTTAGIYKVNQRQLEAVTIPTPGLPEQKAVFSRATETFVSVEQLRKRSTDAQTRSNGLRRALLNVAFTGRLNGSRSDLERVEEMAGV